MSIKFGKGIKGGRIMNNFIKRVAFSLLIICIMFSNAILVFAEKKSNEIIVSNNFAEQNLQEEGEIGEVEIVQEPKKIDYNVGEKFEPVGLKFKLPSGKTITYSALNASSFRFEPSINEELR